MSAPHFLARESQCLLQFSLSSALPRPPLQSSISSRNPKQLSSWLGSAPHGNLIFFEWGNDHPGKPIHRSVKMPTLCFIYSHLDLWMERAFCSHAIICKQKNEVKITDIIPLVYPRLWHFFYSVMRLWFPLLVAAALARQLFSSLAWLLLHQFTDAAHQTTKHFHL